MKIQKFLTGSLTEWCHRHVDVSHDLLCQHFTFSFPDEPTHRARIRSDVAVELSLPITHRNISKNLKMRLNKKTSGSHTEQLDLVNMVNDL